MESPNKERVEELRGDWRRLWRERIDDRLRAEAIADKDYDRLFVERGTVIFATRRFKMLSFVDILKLHGFIDAERFAVNPTVGGWGKFIRTHITGGNTAKRVRRALFYGQEKRERQQLKKGGRGWLHMV